MEQTAVTSVRSYLHSEFPGVSVELSPEAAQGKKSRTEFNFMATMFRLTGVERVLYVSDVLLDDRTEQHIEALLRQHDIARELWEVGSHPLLLTPRGPVLILEWIGPLELTEGDIHLHTPTSGGVYLLAEPLEDERWLSLFVDRHHSLRSQLQLFARKKEFGKIHCYFFTNIDSGILAPEILRDRITKYIAATCRIDDPTDPDLKPLRVNLPPGIADARLDPRD